MTLSILGCEEDIAPSPGSESPFAIYGVVTPDLDTQAVKIFPVEATPQLLPAELLDAVVTSTDLVTGEVRTWTDSIVTNRSGQIRHIFWSAFRAEAGHTYRIEATRPSDGAVSFAEVGVPPPVTIRLDESAAPIVQVVIEGENVRALKPEIRYTARLYDPAAPTDPGGTFTLTMSHQGQEQPVPNGWVIPVPMHEAGTAFQLRFTANPGVNCQGIGPGFALTGMWLNLLVGNAEWNPEGGIFDPDVLSHPGLLSNVRNGYGFVAGGYRIEERLHPSEETVEAACFYYVPELILP